MLTETQFQTIALHLPSKTKPPKYSAYQVLNGILFVMSSGCSWSGVLKSEILLHKKEILARAKELGAGGLEDLR
jgi:hypothetical protein